MQILISVIGFVLILGFLSALVRSIRESNKKHAEDIKLFLDGLGSLREMAKMTIVPEPALNPLPVNPPAEGFVRVYSLNYINKVSLRVLTVLATGETYSDATLKAMEIIGKMGENFSDWILNIRNSIDVAYPVKEIKKEPTLKDFINSLHYSSDKFAETEPEKKAISRVIERIEKQYDKKTG